MKKSRNRFSRVREARSKQSPVVFEELPKMTALPYDQKLLERSWVQWQFGDWERLAQLQSDGFQHNPDRANLALLAAAGRFQTGQYSDAKAYMRLAQDLGVSKKLIVMILTSGALNSLGRAAALAGDMPRAIRSFESAILAGNRDTDTRLITMARSTEQLAQIQRSSACAALSAPITPSAHTVQINDGEINASQVIFSSVKSETYDKAFYEAQKNGSELSAREVLPVLFRHFKPRTLIDIGCGVGTWVKVAKELGVELVLGVDGGYAIAGLVIPESSFIPHDLSKPLGNLGRFELAMSLEVAEHLDPDRADGFVGDLCCLSDTILFSAAIPHQGGTDHRNENWPEYWAKKFQHHGYVPLDFLRESLWKNNKVEWWYRQNILVFVRESVLDKVFTGMAKASTQYLTRIHPDLLIKRATRR